MIWCCVHQLFYNTCPDHDWLISPLSLIEHRINTGNVPTLKSWKQVFMLSSVSLSILLSQDTILQRGSLFRLVPSPMPRWNDVIHWIRNEVNNIKWTRNSCVRKFQERCVGLTLSEVTTTSSLTSDDHVVPARLYDRTSLSLSLVVRPSPYIQITRCRQIYRQKNTIFGDRFISRHLVRFVSAPYKRRSQVN